MQEVVQGEDARELRTRSAKLFGVSLFSLMASAFIAIGVPEPFRLMPFGATCAFAIVGVVFGIAALARGGLKHGIGAIAASLFFVVANLALANLGAFAAYVSTMSFSRGRQIRRRGKTLLPPVAEGDAWARRSVDELDIDVGPETRRALADQWRENGRTEHASVAAFAKLTLDLVALGAPPELIEAANRDALDEIRHTKMCFSLARAIDGAPESPAAFPEVAKAPSRSRSRTLALADLAVESLVDGALNEGVSARIVARLARRCAEPTIKELLKSIAADEGRHAAHGWDVVRWCLAEGGAPVAHALAGAARALPATLVSTLDPESRDGGWERWGIPGAALEEDELAKTRADVVRRVEALVAPLLTRAA